MSGGFLEAKIFVFVFGKIKGFCLKRDTLTGVIGKLTTLVGERHDTLFYTKNLIIGNSRSVNAVTAGTRHFFTKQHIPIPQGVVVVLLYNTFFVKASTFGMFF
jgi:hypothetical protein